MANILGIITVDEIYLIATDFDPSTSGGVYAVPGSLCFNKTTGTIHVKWGTNDTDWNTITSNFGSFLSSSIDGKTTGSTLIGTTRINGSEKFYPQICHIILTSVTGFAVAPTITIGTNSTSYNNIIASTALTGLSTAGDFYALTLLNPISAIAGGTGIYINIGTGATSTTYNILTLVRGFYA